MGVQLPAWTAPLQAFNSQADTIVGAVTGKPSGKVGIRPEGVSTIANAVTSQSDARPMSKLAAANDLRDFVMGRADDVIERKAKELGLELSDDMTRVEKVAAVLKKLGSGEEAKEFKRDLAAALGPLGHTINLGVKDLARYAPDRKSTQSGYLAEVLKETTRLIASDRSHWSGATSARDSAPPEVVRDARSTRCGDQSAIRG